MTGMRLSKDTTRKIDRLVKMAPGPEVSRQAYIAWLIDRELKIRERELPQETPT